MATRANIGVRESDGIIKAIYSHNDGYPEYLGAVLRNHYATESEVRDLLALGDVSFVAATLDKTIAYHRDRGEELREATEFAPGVFRVQEEYGYVFDTRVGGWLWTTHDMGEGDLQPLTEADVARP